MKRLVSMLLISLLLMAACSSNTSDENKESAPSDTTAAVTEAETLSDELPDRDFEGAAFQFLTRECCTHSKGLFANENSGDTVENAVYTRNRLVEERFNITIAEPVLDTDAMPEKLVNAIMSGDGTYDAAVVHFRYLGSMVVSGYLADLTDVEYLDFDKIWWATDIIHNYNAYGRYFAIQGSIDIDNLTDLGALYFNKGLLENTSPGTDLYAMAANGEWTMDELTGLVEKGGADLNGDGVYSFETDQNAYVSYAGFSSLYQYAMDQPTTVRDSEGVPEIAINTEKMVNIADKVYFLSKGLSYTHVVESAPPEIFTNGRTLFYAATLSAAINASLRAMDADYGIVPFPKYDTAQERYFSHASAHSALIGVPVTNTELEYTGIILEAMVAEGYKTIRPVLYENALAVKGVRDEESIEMIDIIFAGRTSDFADIHDEWGLAYILDHLVRGNIKSFASYFASQSKMEQKLLDKVIEFYAQAASK